MATSMNLRVYKIHFTTQIELEARCQVVFWAAKLSHIFSYSIIEMGLADSLRTSVSANNTDTRRAVPQSAKRKSIHPTIAVSVCKLIFLNKFPFPRKHSERTHTLLIIPGKCVLQMGD